MEYSNMQEDKLQNFHIVDLSTKFNDMAGAGDNESSLVYCLTTLIDSNIISSMHFTSRST